MSGDPRPTVAHLLGTWLRPTENWIERQLRAVRGYRQIVLAKHREAADRFPWEPAYVLSDRALPVQGVHRLMARWTGVLPLFRRASRREGVRLVHAHFGHLGSFALPMTRALNVPLVTSFYGVDMWKHEEGVEGLRARYAELFAGGAAFLAEGPAARDRLVEIGAPPEKVWVHRLGVDTSEIPFVERRPGIGGAMRLLMAARFTEKKGLSYGLEAFCRVATADLRLSLTIVGGANGADEERVGAELRRIAASHGMRDRVSFVGFLSLPELEAAMRDHHLLMHPSVHAANGDAEGGHPVVLTQAAAGGMPILATRHCDIPEIVVHGETGWLCPERDMECLAEALREFSRHPEALPEMGRKARALVEERYDVNRATLDDVYDRVLAGSRSASSPPKAAAASSAEDAGTGDEESSEGMTTEDEAPGPKEAEGG